MKRSSIFVGLLGCVALLALSAGCSSDLNKVGPNGNGYLSDLDIRNCTLVTETAQTGFSAAVTNYSVIRWTNERMYAKILPAYYKSRVFVNGDRFKPMTNDIGIPTYTDITASIDKANPAVIKVVNEAGLEMVYRVNLLGPESDASIKAIRPIVKPASTDPATFVDTGTLFPKYEEDVGPTYSRIINGAVNRYSSTAGTNSYRLIVTKGSAGSKIYLTSLGTNPTDFAEVVTNSPDVFRDYTATTFTRFVKVRCVSQNGKYTNEKVITVKYLPPQNDSRLLDVAINGEKGMYPDFAPDALSYYMATDVDQSRKVRLTLTKSQAGQRIRVSVFSNSSLDGTRVATAYPGQVPGLNVFDATTNRTVSIDVTATSDDSVSVFVTNSSGAGYNEYKFKLGVFTKAPYSGFKAEGKTADGDGGIKDLLDDITQNGENFKKVVVQGILTVKDFWGWENAKKCLFIEDGRAGLYVFLNDAVYAGLKTKPEAKFKTGCRVSMRITAGQLYYEMAEAVGIDELKLEDPNPRPLMYREGGFDRVFARGKMWKHKATVKTTLNNRGEGDYTDASLFFVNRYKTYIGDPLFVNAPELADYFGRFKSGFQSTVYGPVIWSYSYHRIALFRPEYSRQTLE